MASPANAALCALIAGAFWTFLDYGVGRHLLPRSLALNAPIPLGQRSFRFDRCPGHVAHLDLHPHHRQPARPGKEIQCQSPFHPTIVQ